MNEDWVAGAGTAVVVAVLAMPKPPKAAVVEFWPEAAWLKVNAPWGLAVGAGCVAAEVVVIPPN